MVLPAKVRCAVAAVIVLALMFTPAPLLPAHRVAEALQSLLGIGWAGAYLVAAILIRGMFYSGLGILAAFAFNRAPTRRGRLFQVAITPLAVIGLALVIRSVKVGHPPIWVNSVIPIAGCFIGVSLGLAMVHRHWKPALMMVVAMVAVGSWGLLGGRSAALSLATQEHLKHIVEQSAHLPSGDARFGAMLQAAFAPVPSDKAMKGGAVQRNRAAILAWGIATGHYKLARLVGLNPNSELVQRAASLQPNTTLRGREDWPRHYSLSAALAVLEHPLISDAGGLLKEELDALSGGSGFSLGDLLADRAGVRFAMAATGSEAAALDMQERLKRNFVVEDFFPPTVDLPENLNVRQFRQHFGGIGSREYRVQAAQMEEQLDSCSALSRMK